MWDFGGSMGMWMGFGWIFALLFWGALLGVIIWAVVRFTRGTTGGKSNKALDIAAERYARGDISREEFERIKKDLS